MGETLSLEKIFKIVDLSPGNTLKFPYESNGDSGKIEKEIKTFSALQDHVSNYDAKKIKSKKGKTIGVVIPTIQIHFFALALESMIYEANKKGYRILACISDGLAERERDNLEFLIQNQVEGIVMSPSNETQKSLEVNHLIKMKHLKLPLVLFGGVDDKTEFNDFCLTLNRIERRANEQGSLAIKTILERIENKSAGGIDLI